MRTTSTSFLADTFPLPFRGRAEAGRILAGRLKSFAGQSDAVVVAIANDGVPVAAQVAAALNLPLGVQVLAGANREAIAVAHACGAAFVRAEGFVFAHVADEGLIDAGAGELLRYRRAIGADHVRVFADIKKKHAAHALTADVDVVETARAAEFFLADGVIVTGAATGRAADPREVAAVRAAIEAPVFVGSGLTPENFASFAGADGFIVGSSVKQDGVWTGPLERRRLLDVVRAFRALGAGA